jgi:hypothetical protein
MTTFWKPLWVLTSLVMNKNKEASYSFRYSYSYSWPAQVGPTAVSETSSVNSSRTPCEIPKAKKKTLQLSVV